MSERALTLHTFCSVKGGVGKSTLAVVCAKLLAHASKKVPVVVDCDLMGTSLSDGLDLLPPGVNAVDEARALRNERGNKGAKAALPYFNDVLNDVYAGVEDDPRSRVDVQSRLWRHQHDDGVLYLPSSSVYLDVEKSLDWYRRDEPYAWSQSLLWALDDLVHQRLDLTDIVLDLPSGTWGLPHEAMVIAVTLLSGLPLPEGYPSWNDGALRVRANPFLITSGDRSDLLPALEYLGRRRRENVTELRLLANRATEGLGVIQGRARAMLPPAIRETGLEQFIEHVPEIPVLREIFKAGDTPVNEEIQRLLDVLRIQEGS